MKECFRIFFLVVLIGFIVVYSLIAVLSSLELVFFSDDDNQKEIASLFNYRMIQRNSVTRETSSSIVSIPVKIDIGDSKLKESMNDQTLISNFEDTQYVCTGKCYCEQERRVSALQFSVSTLLVSVSSILAFSLAKNQFSEKCEMEMKNFCINNADNNNLIKSEVEECKKIIEGELQYDDYEDEVPEEFVPVSDEDEPPDLIKITEEDLIELKEPYKRYYCFGRCRPNSGRLKRVETLREAKVFGCEKMEFGERVLQVIGVDGMGATHVSIKGYFKTEIKRFCEKNSRMDDPYGEDKVVIDRKEWMTLQYTEYEDRWNEEYAKLQEKKKKDKIWKNIDKPMSYCTFDVKTILCEKQVVVEEF